MGPSFHPRSSSFAPTTTYACRPGKGVHQAVKKVQQCLCQHPWYVKIDIDSYFASIDHALLMATLTRRFKGSLFLSQLERIIDSYHFSPHRGLPIGSLTSQYFANYFLDNIDRLLANQPGIKAQVRYMDDIIWWCNTKVEARQSLSLVRNALAECGLTVKSTAQVQQSRRGVSYCGFRILPNSIRLSLRRKRRFQQLRHYWEKSYQQGAINEQQLQQAYTAVESICAGTNSSAWRRKNLALYPPLGYDV